MPFRLLRALRARLASAVRNANRSTRSGARCAAEILEDRRLLTVSIDTPFQYDVEGYTAAFFADFSADTRPISAEANWADGTVDPLATGMMDYDASTGRGRLYGIHSFASAGDWTVTFTISQDTASDSETFVASIGGGGTSSPTSASFAGSDALTSDAATSETSATAAASSFTSAVNALDLAFVRQRLNKTSTNPGTTGAIYSPFADIIPDGNINALDISAVKQRLNTRLPDGEPATPSSAAQPVGQFQSFPQVQQVYVNGPGLTGQTSTNGVAFRTSLSVDNMFGYPVAALANQLKPIPWNGGINQISLRFTQEVATSLQQGDLVIRGVNTPIYTTTAFAYDPTTKTGTWTLASAITNDKLRLFLDDALIAGLDGDWINPSDMTSSGYAFPSGNGAPGGDFDFRLNVLRGDAKQGDPPAANVDLVAYRTGAKLGEAVSQAVEDSTDPTAYLVLTNNDFEEGAPDGQPDNSNDTAAIGLDDDLAKITLRRIPSNLDARTVELQLSDPTAVRLFKADGTLLYEAGVTSPDALTLNLLSPSGYLSGLPARDVDIYVEGLRKSTNLEISYVVYNGAGEITAVDDVHMLLANQRFVNEDGVEISTVDTVPINRLRDLLNDVQPAPVIPAGARFWIEIDGLPPAAAEVKVTSATVTSDNYVDEPDTGTSFRSKYPGIVYSADADETLSDAEKAALRDRFGVNAVHNQDAPDVQTTTRAQVADVQNRKAPELGWTLVPDQEKAFDLILFTSKDVDPQTKEAQDYATARNSKLVKVTTRRELVDAIIARSNELTTDPNNPKKLKILIVGHGNDVDGPAVGGGAGDPANSWQPLFETTEVNLDAYEDQAKLTNYKTEILPHIELIRAQGKIDELIFTDCRIATSVGARNVIDAVREGLGIAKVTAGKQYMETGWRKKDGVWITEIGAYDDAAGKKPLKKATPREDVIYDSTAAP